MLALVVDRVPVVDAIAAARAWTDYLGIAVVARTFGSTECPRRWWHATSPCQVTMQIVAVDGLREKVGTNALVDRASRVAQFDARLVGQTFNLRVAIAHEVGHVLLDTDEHVAGGVMGGADLMLNDADRALARSALAR